MKSTLKKSSEEILQELVRRLGKGPIRKIILFGSYAEGRADEESDLDLYIVTSEETIPQSYEEQRDHYLEISGRIRDLRGEFPIDLIVHTMGMYRKFLERGGSFARRIRDKGVVLYES